MLVAGSLNLVTSVMFERSTYAGLPAVIWVIVYSGLIPVGIGFTLQVIGQKHAPPSDAALILSLEAVFGALSGFLLLGEGLTLLQVGGCALIFGAILLSQYT
jgi:drug/metabolite transporter (DMT)-like permease